MKKMKLAEPKIAFLEDRDFTACLKSGEFRNVRISTNVEQPLTIAATPLDSCEFIGITFTDKIIMENVNIYDCRFINCDLSNITFYDRGIHRCVFDNCKLMGTSFESCSMIDVRFNRINGRYLNIAASSLKHLSFTDAVLKGASLSELKVDGLILDGCGLEEAEIFKSNLEAVDISTCAIDGIAIDAASLRGLVVSTQQALALAALLGIKIK